MLLTNRGGIRFRKGGDLDQSIKLVQVLAALWNFILAQENPDDDDEDYQDGAPILGQDIVVDDEIPPQPAHVMPTNAHICNIYYRTSYEIKSPPRNTLGFEIL